MAYPGCDHQKLQNLLLNLKMTDQVVVFTAETLQLWQQSLSNRKTHRGHQLAGTGAASAL